MTTYTFTEAQLYALLRNACSHALVMKDTGAYDDSEAEDEAAQHQIRELDIERELLGKEMITRLLLQQITDNEEAPHE